MAEIEKRSENSLGKNYLHTFFGEKYCSKKSKITIFLTKLFDFENALIKEFECKRAEKNIIFYQNSVDIDNVHNIQNTNALKVAANIIASLSDDGEAGLIHLNAISEVIRRRIRVLNSNGELKYTIGKYKKVRPVNVQYFEPNYSNKRGHYTLPGGKEPLKTGGTNDCLFNVIAEQIDLEPTDLRRRTVEFLKNNLHSLAKQALEFKLLFHYKKDALCFGGATYAGTSSADAGRVLDRSQNVSGYAHAASGHPRGHASHSKAPSVPGSIDCVENYSYSGWKTGFLSRDDQSVFAHYALITPAAKKAMNRLNSGGTREVVPIPVWSLGMPGDYRAGEWSQGQMINQPFKPSSVLIILQHHQGKQNDPSAPVHVHTFYPKK